MTFSTPSSTGLSTNLNGKLMFLSIDIPILSVISPVNGVSSVAISCSKLPPISIACLSSSDLIANGAYPDLPSAPVKPNSSCISSLIMKNIGLSSGSRYSCSLVRTAALYAALCFAASSLIPRLTIPWYKFSSSCS